MIDTLVLCLPYAFMLCTSVYCIYSGCNEVALSKSFKKEERIDTKAAIRFPFIGSAVLFGLYVLYKYLRPEYINLLLSLYFCLMGIFAVNAHVRQFLGHNPVVGVCSILVGIIQFWQVDWVTNNIIGISFCVQAIKMIPLSSVRVGILLLSLLFFYDIFWVFGTDVMVTVAKSVKGPIKLLFPRNIFAEKYEYSLLGLGDIVLPGFYIATMLRYDLRENSEAATATRMYYRTALWCYTLGLMNTFLVMFLFQAAQPALLYLVPWTVGGTLLMAIKNGSIRSLLQYDTSADEEDEDKQDNTIQAAGKDGDKTSNGEDGQDMKQPRGASIVPSIKEFINEMAGELFGSSWGKVKNE